MTTAKTELYSHRSIGPAQISIEMALYKTKWAYPRRGLRHTTALSQINGFPACNTAIADNPDTRQQKARQKCLWQEPYIDCVEACTSTLQF